MRCPVISIDKVLGPVLLYRDSCGILGGICAPIGFCMPERRRNGNSHLKTMFFTVYSINLKFFFSTMGMYTRIEFFPSNRAGASEEKN